MSKSDKKRILSSVPVEHFVERTDELDQLLRHAKGQNESEALFIMAAPGSGLTELLWQTYDQLFYEQGEIIPFYFRIKSSDKTGEQLATRFLQEFLSQVVAFRRNDPRILLTHPDVCEIAQLSIPSDGHWIDRIIETCEIRSRLNDQSASIRNALSAPHRAAAHGAKVFVMIDDLDAVDQIRCELDLIDELKEIYSRAEIRFVFAGKRRFVHEAAQNGRGTVNGAKSFDLKEFSFAQSGRLAEGLAAQFNLNITDQSRDLISQQFRGNPSLIKLLFQTACENGIDLDTFHKVEETYASALFGGRIKGYYDSIFGGVAPDVEIEKKLIRLLYNAMTVDREKNPVESWRKHLETNPAEFYRLITLLNTNEIVSKSSNLLETTCENDVLSDYITSRFRLEILGDSRSLVIAESISEFLKRAPERMSSFYRRKSAVGLRELMAFFNCQEIPLGLLDYESFKENYKGRETEAVSADVKSETATMKLPQIVYTAHTVSVYTPISKLTENERSAVALGFEAADYKDESEIVWIAAEIDSKLEANEDLAAFWCDRLEMVALMCDFARYRLWLIAPEGFTPEALKTLKRRNAIGSSRDQVELLAGFLGAENIGEQINTNEYEMVLPMGDDTELIAAYALEEIARKHSFQTKAINQIKTALVEACINATEHSHSPDRKIYQKFAVEDDKIVITVSNRGLRFKGKEAENVQPDEGRRGWGLKLMKSLMDEVTFEQVDDGTRISMTKKLVKQ